MKFKIDWFILLNTFNVIYNIFNENKVLYHIIVNNYKKFIKNN